MTQNRGFLSRPDRAGPPGKSAAVPAPAAAEDRAADRAAGVVVTGGREDGDVLLDLARADLVEDHGVPSPEPLGGHASRLQLGLDRLRHLVSHGAPGRSAGRRADGGGVCFRAGLPA